MNPDARMKAKSIDSDEILKMISDISYATFMMIEKF